MGEVSALPCTLLARGCRDSLKLASGLQAKPLTARPGHRGTSPDTSLPGHFSIHNDLVGETQKGGVKTFGNPSTRETWDTHTCFKLLLPGVRVLPFFYVSSTHILWSLLLAGLADHEWKWGLPNQSCVSQFCLSSPSCPQSHRLHFKDRFDKPVFFASPSFLAPV